MRACLWADCSCTCLTLVPVCAGVGVEELLVERRFLPPPHPHPMLLLGGYDLLALDVLNVEVSRSL
jgi:hypothetical protein